MSIRNDTAPLPTTSLKNRWDPLLDSERHKFGVQSTPPLSLRQFLRSTITVIPGGKQWKPAGIHHASLISEDLPPKSANHPPQIVIKPCKNSRRPWYPPGPIKYKPSKSPSEENKLHRSEGVITDSRTNTNSNIRSKATRKVMPQWYPSGNPYYEPVPYFDAPSLRWSSQQIKQSMPEFKSTTNNSSTNQK
jgi:hypothetical protein